MITQRLVLTVFFVGMAANAPADDAIMLLAMGDRPEKSQSVQEVQAAPSSDEATVEFKAEPIQAAAPAVVDSAQAVEPAVVDGPVVVAPQNLTEEPCIVPNPLGYAIGVGDLLTVNVVRPEPLLMEVTVSPDGTISFPYIGTVVVKGKTLDDVQSEMTKKLGEGYMKYPVLSVTLKESRSKRFYVYGEVATPGPYTVEENMTVLRAISMAGGFTKFGSSSRVKVLRPRAAGRGYEPVKINLKDVMEGNPDADTIIKPGDIVVVSEGVF